MLIGILSYLMIMGLSFYIGRGFTYYWEFGYTLRSKFKIFNMKPFNCRCCLTFWLFIITSMICFPHLIVLNCVNGLLLFFITSYVEKWIN